MFSKISRYRKLPDVVTVDAQGRTLAAKSLRLLPEVTGTFEHTVTEADRLDNLAFIYYQQPRKWWRICDASPEFLSPQALLGKEPIVTARFPLTFAGTGQPPWAGAAKSLSHQLGVERFRFVDEVDLVPQPQIIAGQPVTVQVERHRFAALVTHNRLNVATTDLAANFVAAGFGVLAPEIIGQVGKRILIPPDVVG